MKKFFARQHGSGFTRPLFFVKNKGGFTMVELIVVVAIVAIVVSILVVGVARIRSQSRDQTRIADIKATREALELYFNRYSAYPASLTAGQPLMSPDGATTFLKKIPTNPTPADGSCAAGDYTYAQTGSGLAYTLTYCLGKAIGAIAAGINIAKPETMGEPTCVPSCTGKCAGESDGCTGTCTCSGNLVCYSGSCCTPSCSSKGAASGCGFTCSNDIIFESHNIGENPYNPWGVFDSANNKVAVGFIHNAVTVGTLGIVGTPTTASISFGSTASFDTDSNTYVRGTFDSVNSKVVLMYSDQGSSSYGTVVVGTVSGTSISFGTPVVFSSANTRGGITFDSANGKVVVAYSDGTKGYARVGTVSGTSISFGTAAEFSASANTYVTPVYDSANGKVVVVWSDGTNEKAIVGTVSGTSISFGTAATISSEGYIYGHAAVYDSANGKVVALYQNWGYSYGKAAVGTVSGTSISFGAVATFSTENAQYLRAVYDASSGKVVAVYKNNSNLGRAVVGTVSGTDISFNSAISFGGSACNNIGLVYDSNLHKNIIFYTTGSNGMALVTTVLNGALSYY